MRELGVAPLACLTVRVCTNKPGCMLEHAWLSMCDSVRAWLCVTVCVRASLEPAYLHTCLPACVVSTVQAGLQRCRRDFLVPCTQQLDCRRLPGDSCLFDQPTFRNLQNVFEQYVVLLLALPHASAFFCYYCLHATQVTARLDRLVSFVVRYYAVGLPDLSDLVSAILSHAHSCSHASPPPLTTLLLLLRPGPLLWTCGGAMPALLSRLLTCRWWRVFCLRM